MCSIVLDCRGDLDAQNRQYFLFEPRVFAHPDRAAPGWVGQGQEVREELAEPPNTLGHRHPAGVRQIPALRIGSHQQGQPVRREDVEYPFVPLRRTFGPRGLIATAGLAGIAEPHGDQRHLRGIIHRRLVEPCPFSQPISTGIVPWNATFMDF